MNSILFRIENGSFAMTGWGWLTLWWLAGRVGNGWSKNRD